MKIQLVTKNAPEYTEGTARDEWFKAVIRHEGKSVDAFIKNTKRNPPILKKDGIAEAPQGWLNYFVREQVIKLA